MATLTETETPEVQERPRTMKPAVAPREPTLPPLAPREYRTLFSDSLLESGSPEKQRRTWTTVVSYSIAHEARALASMGLGHSNM
jgi:hypothetical protein